MGSQFVEQVKGCLEGSGVIFHDDVIEITGGGGGTPGGSDKQIQFNDSGAFGGVPNFEWDSVANTLSFVDTTSGPTVAFVTGGTDASFYATGGDSGNITFQINDGSNNIVLQNQENAPGGGGIILLTTNTSGSGEGINIHDSNVNDGSGIALFSDHNSISLLTSEASEGIHLECDNGGTITLRGDGGSACDIQIGNSPDTLNFFSTNVPGVGKQTVTGVKADPVAVSILNALVAYGMVTDGTT